MGKTRLPYPAEFRQQIVELHQAGHTQAQLAREFGVSAPTIASWVTRRAEGVIHHSDQGSQYVRQ